MGGLGMYINFNNLTKSGISWENLEILLKIKQEELTGELWLKNKVWLESEPLVTSIKGGKEEDWKKLRLSKKGKDFMDKLGEAEVELEDIQIWNWISEHYKKMGKDAGAKARTLTYIRDFRLHTNISRNKLVNLIATFLRDEKEMSYSNKAQNIFYKSDNVYSTKFNKDGSRLYQYYLRHQEAFCQEWAKLEYNR